MNPKREGEVGRVLLSSSMLGFNPEVMEAARRHILDKTAPPPAAFHAPAQPHHGKTSTVIKVPPHTSSKKKSAARAQIQQELERFYSLAEEEDLCAHLLELRNRNRALEQRVLAEARQARGGKKQEDEGEVLLLKALKAMGKKE